MLPLRFLLTFLVPAGMLLAACGSSNSTVRVGKADPGKLSSPSPSPQVRTSEQKEETKPEEPTRVGDKDVSTVDKPTQNQPAPPKRYLTYVGSSAEFIAVLSFDSKTGTLSEVEKFSLPGSQPTFLAIHPNRKWLYAANEVGNGGVIALLIDNLTGKLSKLNEVKSGGQGPTHVSIDASGRWVFSANYSSGKVVVLPILSDGSLGSEVTNIFAGQNAHQILTSPNGKGVYVPCKGANHIAQYVFDSSTGALSSLSPATLTPLAGGPRHMAFHPSKPWAFVVQENANTLQALLWGSDSGLLSKNGDPISTLGSGGKAGSSAEVQVHANGRYVYSSNRGDDSIARFEIGSAGTATFKETAATGGKTPRHFSIDPTGRWLLVGNAGSNFISVFSIEPESGALTLMPSRHVVGSPQFVQVVEIP